jgi:hypothetical protein
LNENDQLNKYRKVDGQEPYPRVEAATRQFCEVSRSSGMKDRSLAEPEVDAAWHAEFKPEQRLRQQQL